jgi:DNA polymerase-4
VRFADFTTITRSRTLNDPTDVAVEVYAAVCDLFARLALQRARLRLVGVRVEGLTAATASYRQLALDARAHGWPDAERAADRAVTRFGRSAVVPATLLRTRRP